VILSIAMNEFKSLFRIPLGWVILALCLFLFGTTYYSLIINYLHNQHAAIPVDGISHEIASTLFGASIYSLIVAVPALAMRVISNEKHHNTLCLLYAAPVSEFQIVAGKFIGVIIYLSILLLAMLIMSMSLAVGGILDYGIIFSSLFGILLVIICFTSIAFWIASLSSQPTVTITAAMCTLLFIIFLESIAITKIAWLDSTIAWLSLVTHLDSFLRGIIQSQDIFYFVVISGCTLTFTLLQFRKLRRTG